MASILASVLAIAAATMVSTVSPLVLSVSDPAVMLSALNGFALEYPPRPDVMLDWILSNRFMYALWK